MKKFTRDMIIWSADFEKDQKEQIKLIVDSKVLPEGTVIKLDRTFFEKYDKDFISYCQDKGYPVFCDAKITEIPKKILDITDIYLEHKPFMLNIMGDSCNTPIIVSDENENTVSIFKRFADHCKEAGTKSCIVTVLTSKSPEMCKYEYQREPIDQVLQFVSLAHDAGMTDIVCSPKEAAAIRAMDCYRNMEVNTPGVRLPGSSKDDQQRVMTPYDALQAGANRLVIGRDLTRGDGDIIERIKRNYNRIVENIETGK